MRMYNLLHKVYKRALIKCAQGALSLFRPNVKETALLVHLIVLSGNMTSTAYAFHGYAVQRNSRPTDIPLHSVHAMIALRMYVR